MADNSSNSSGSSYLTSMLGVFAALVVFAVLVILACVLVYGLGGSKEDVIAESGDQPPSAATLHAQEKETLSTFGWVDKEKGTVRIPVERATELVIEELNQ